MRAPCLLLWAVALLTPCLNGHAGSYPPGAGAVTQSFEFPDGTTDLSDGTLIGSDRPPGGAVPVAGVFDGALRLSSPALTNAIGAFRLPDLDPGNVLRSFDAKFTVRMDAPTGGVPGEGWSFNFGPLPPDNGTGEGGFAPLPRGLTIAFDTHDTGDGPTAIEVSVGGVVVGSFPRNFSFDPIFRTVLIHWDAAGLDLSYENKVVCTDLPTPGFSPGVGHAFAFTSRSTASSMDVSIDSLRVATVPQPVIESGGPVISEFVANNSLLEDEYADKPGWIELLNGSADPVDLTGWYLTDSKSNLARWRIQGLVLNPYSYQLVFASGRDRQLSSSNLMHAGFTLDKGGGYLALVRPDGRTVASAYTYGPQDRNVSQGEAGTNRVRGYMAPPSPGLVNTQAPQPSSLAPEVGFSVDSGFLSDPIQLALAVPNLPGIEVRYTLDRTEPGPNSPRYTNAIPISGLTTVRARSYATGHLPGPVSSRTYVFMDATLSDYARTGKAFESNLPFLYVDSYGFSVDAATGGVRPYRPSFVMCIRPDPATGRATMRTPAEYAGPCGVHLRGESSAGFDQRSYALELQDESGLDRAASLLDMPADSDWVLYGPWSEKTLMRNKLIFDWMRTLRGDDGTAVRTRFVELFFNQTRPASGRVGYGTYRGIYVLMEKIKRGKDRVPLANLNDKTTAPDLVTGGYILRKDKDDPLKSNWNTSQFIPLQSFDPDKFNVAQSNYIKGYVNTFEKALAGTAFRNPRTGYAAYCDPDTFIDAQWMLEVAKQVDGYVFSTYFHKDRGGRFRAGPLWDFNIALGNADYGSGETPKGWLYDVPDGVGQLWYPRLHADPDYRVAHWDRYWQMRRGMLATDAVMRTIDGHMATLLDGYTGGVSNRAPDSIQNPVARHFRRWPRLGQRDWPNPVASTTIKTWQEEVGYMKNWIRTRLDWLDDQSLRSGKAVLRPPVLSHAGGTLAAPLQLTLAPFQAQSTNSVYPDGIVYYTLDRSDPRLPGGGVSGNAQRYARPLEVGRSLTVNARLLAGNQWSPLATATFWFDAVPADASNLVVSEVLYRPAPLTAEEVAAGVVDPEKFEFVELRNRSRRTVDLTGVRFAGGIDFDFRVTPAATRLLRPGESRVVAADVRAFSLRNPRVPSARVAGPFRGQLNNGGETLTLLAADGSVIQDFRYDDKAPWPDAGSGEGYSLVLETSLPDPRAEDPTHWRLSAQAGGTPGVSGRGGDRFIGDPTRDSDGDGVGDLLEFATGLDAEDPDSARPVQVAVLPVSRDGVEVPHLTVSVRRNPRVTGVTTVLEASDDLRAWRSVAPELVPVESRENPDGSVTDVYRGAQPWSAGGSAAWFMRLRARLP